MAVLTILFAAIGFLSPANRGALMIGATRLLPLYHAAECGQLTRCAPAVRVVSSALVMLFLGMGVAAGYTAARSYKTFKGKNWQKTTLYTAFLFPGTIFTLVFIMNLFVWAEGSSQAIPFVDMFVVLVRRRHLPSLP